MKRRSLPSLGLLFVRYRLRKIQAEQSSKGPESANDSQRTAETPVPLFVSQSSHASLARELILVPRSHDSLFKRRKASALFRSRSVALAIVQKLSQIFGAVEYSGADSEEPDARLRGRTVSHVPFCEANEFIISVTS
jgi:hypothetical protein